MEVGIFVPAGTNMEVIEKEYPDLEMDGDEGDRYFVGNSNDEEHLDDKGKPFEWLTYREAVACCGFVEGAIPEAETLIEGNGGWAQGIISRKDFSSLAISASEKRACKRTSNLFWKNFKRGQAAVKKAFKRKSAIANRKSQR